MSLKIYHIGLFDHNEPILAMRRAFSELCEAGNYREISWPNYMLLNSSKENKQAHFEHDAITVMEELKPDIVFVHVQNGEALGPRILQYLRNSPAFSVGFTGDVREPLPQFYLDFGKYLTLSLFTNMNDVRTCLAHGINADFIHVGYDDKIYTPEGYVDPNEAPIVFLANNYGNMFPLSRYRLDIVRNLSMRFGEDFKVYGQNWHELGFNSHLMFNPQAEAIAYRSCKIAINCSHFDYERYSSDRLNRIMGCGAFCLSQHYQGIEQDFTVGTDLDTFHNIGQLIEKIELYLNDEQITTKIKRNGYEKISKNYTFKTFARKVVEFYQRSGYESRA